MSPPLSIYNKRNTPPLSSKSLESFNSTGSCCPREYSSLQMYKKSTRFLGQGTVHKAVSEVRQRVTSARMNRQRALQNQLSDAHGHIGELLNENRLLRSMHKRQDSALARYEGTNAELPQLLNSHAEEIRVWQIRCRNLQSQNRELGNKLKQRDSALLALNDQNRHLSQLNVDKNLEERDKLTERVRQLETQITERDEELKVLHRRMQLEAKGYKHQINSGYAKQKELMLKLEKANAEIMRIGEVIRTESMISPSKMSLGTYIRSNKLNTTIPAKANLIQKNELNDRMNMNGGGDYTKKDTCANKLKPTKSPPASSNSSKIVTRNYSQQSSDAFPLMKSYMAEKSMRSKPMSLSKKIKNSMMDFTEIKYPHSITNKSYLKNSSSMESSDTVHSPLAAYDDDEFDTSSTTHGANDVNNHSDNIESNDELPVIGDYSYEKYQSYSDQRNPPEIGDCGFKRSEDVNRNEIENDIQADLVQNESFLDSFCDSVTKELKILSKDTKVASKDVKNGIEKARIPIRANTKGKETVAKKGRINSSSIKKKTLDPTKKTELLAQLKAIDGAE